MIYSTCGWWNKSRVMWLLQYLRKSTMTGRVGRRRGGGGIERAISIRQINSTPLSYPEYCTALYCIVASHRIAAVYIFIFNSASSTLLFLIPPPRPPLWSSICVDPSRQSRPSRNITHAQTGNQSTSTFTALWRASGVASRQFWP